jgi:hypothetical protein
MGVLLHPVGPESPRVYWVRRLIALLAVGLAITLALLLAHGIAGTLKPVTPSAEPGVSGTDAPSTGSGEPVAPPSETPTPSGPVPCDSLKLTVAGFERISVTGKQTFNLAATNESESPCVADISAETYALTVVSGNDRIWSTADCPEWVPAEQVALAPGESHEFAVEWTLRRSSSGCELSKDQLKPGTYVADATWKNSSGRQVLQLVK